MRAAFDGEWGQILVVEPHVEGVVGVIGRCYRSAVVRIPGFPYLSRIFTLQTMPGLAYSFSLKNVAVFRKSRIIEPFIRKIV